MSHLLFAALLTMRLTAIEKTFDGKLGLWAVDLDTRQRAVLNENMIFPMASVYKMPIAIALLQRVDRGEVSLDTEVTLGPDDYHAGNSPIADMANGKPMKISIGDLLTAMVRDSDNSAVDYILAHYTPPKDVMKTLKSIGARNIDVSRPEAMIIGQMLNEGDVIETRERYAKRIKTMRQDEAAMGYGRFWQDPRDNATPAGIGDLFQKLYEHKVGLSPKSEELLVNLLTTSTTGSDRIRGGIPAEAKLMHKTGTMPGTLNDVGVITSPDGKHHIVIAVLTKWSRGMEEDRARVVAQVTKAVYEELTR